MRISGESANLEIETGALVVPATESRDLFLTQTFNMRNALGDMFDKYDLSGIYSTLNTKF